MDNKPNKDEDLLGRIKDGDRDAWKSLFREHYKYLCAVSYGVCNDTNAAQDMAQEVFLTIWKNRHKLQINTSLDSYLKRSVINRTINHIKSKYKSSTSLDWEDRDVRHEDSAQKLLEYKELDEAMRFAIDSLPDRCREIFLLSRFSDLKNKEIATKLDISIKTVENQITKALKLLRLHYLKFTKK
jgi:RNA polymerase sigma-70 factor (ECF subfamily)